MTLDYAKHKHILLQILKDIYTDTTIAPHLGFKGGTAAMLFYGLPRNSVDLDFDLLDSAKEAQVFEKVRAILEQYGTIVDSHMKRFSILNVVSYEHSAQNIKVEINRRLLSSHYEMRTLLGISMLVMVREDMFAHKLVALYERGGNASRDIFDVAFFAKEAWPLQKELVEARTGMPFRDALQACIEIVERIDNKRMLHGLGELLGEAQKDEVRCNLKDEALFQLRLLLERT